MMKSRSFLLSNPVFIAILILASCAPAATPTPTPALPSSKPTATVAPQPGVSPTPGLQPSPTVLRPGPSPTVPAQQTPSVEQPKYGGILVLGAAADPGSLDSMAEATANANDPARVVYNSLITTNVYDKKLPTVPVLAERWTVGDDGLTYTFFLRKDVKFHDGKPMTAADVVFTRQRYANPPEGVRSTQVGTLENLQRIEAIDDYTVRATVKRRSASALTDLGSGWVYSKSWIEAGGNPLSDTNGTNAFKLKTRSAYVSYTYVKNDSYWQPGRPYLDGITYYVLQDASTRIAAIRTGRIMYGQTRYVAITPTERESVLKTVPTLATWINTAMKIPFHVPNLNRKPWDDLRVRRAIDLGIDRYEWLKVRGEGAGMVCGYLSLRSPGGIPCEELVKRPGWRPEKTADRAEARRLLAEAGFPNGIKTTLMVRSIPEFRDNALFLADQLAQIGIQATLDVQETAVADARGRRQDFELGMWQIGGGAIGDPSSAARSMLTPPGSINFNKWTDQKFVDLFNQQDAELDLTKRAQIVRQMDEYVMEQLPVNFGAWLSDYLWAWPYVKNYPFYDTSGGQNVFDQMWLAK